MPLKCALMLQNKVDGEHLYLSVRKYMSVSVSVW
jgi:hypothetical protein